MKVVVNALPLRGLQTGIGRYVRSLYQELETLGLSPLYFSGTLSTKMPTPPEPQSWSRRTDLLWRLPWPAVVLLRVVFWWRFEHALRRSLNTLPGALYHETTFFPAACDAPQVFTLYDLSLLLRPEDHPRERVVFFRLFFRRRLPRADHVITISETVRTEALTRLGLNPERVTAIPLAPAPHFRPPPEEMVKETKRRYRLPQEYFLFVGTIDPRKNLQLVLEALAHLPSGPSLVIAGWKGWGEEGFKERLARLGLRRRVLTLSYVPDADLPALYAGARALVYPSLYEGFGLPVLEAMACGCPVITSRVSSLPEVAGEAALLVDPHSVEEMVQALKEVLQPETAAELRARGLARAQEFSWEKTALKTLEVFREVAS